MRYFAFKRGKNTPFEIYYFKCLKNYLIIRNYNPSEGTPDILLKKPTASQIACRGFSVIPNRWVTA